MQTWKTKRHSIKTAQKIHKPWKAKVATVLFLLVTLVAGFYDFPHAWNVTSNFVKDKTSLSLGTLDEHAYRLGLDLQGGTHLVYSADMKEIPEKDRANALSGVRDVIERRVNAFGVSEPLVQTTSTGGVYRVIVELAGVLNVTDAIKQIGETPVLEFKEQSLQSDIQITDVDQKKVVELQKADRAAAASVLARALKGEDFDKLVLEVSIDPEKSQTKGVVENVTADAKKYTEIEKVLTQFKPKDGSVYWKTVEEGGVIEIVKVLNRAANKVQIISMKLSNISDVLPPISPWKNTQLSGKQLQNATVEFDPKTGNPYVGITFDKDGGDLFGKLTAANVGKPIAIFLDGSPISIPTVQTAIYGGRAVITGDFTLDESRLLAQRLNAGALPVPVTLLSQQTVGPTLGSVSLQKSIMAALIGFLLVTIYMIGMYRLPGVIAIVALLLFASLNMLSYRIFGVTITLAGIAGLVLSLGIAVDANVLILERLKEEYASGRDLISAADESERRAWAAIRDGHFTTLISSVVLYWFSSSFIRGFALTLGIGVVLSLFTAVYVARQYLHTVFGWKWTHKPVLFAVKRKGEVEREK